MKLFAFILALHTFFLSAAPCEGFGCKDEPQTERSQDGQNDICSPFCICATCSGFTLSPSFAISIEELPTVEYDNDQYPEYSNDFHFMFSLNIWQPPQLG